MPPSSKNQKKLLKTTFNYLFRIYNHPIFYVNSLINQKSKGVRKGMYIELQRQEKGICLPTLQEHHL